MWQARTMKDGSGEFHDGLLRVRSPSKRVCGTWRQSLSRADRGRRDEPNCGRVIRFAPSWARISVLARRRWRRRPVPCSIREGRRNSYRHRLHDPVQGHLEPGATWGTNLPRQGPPHRWHKACEWCRPRPASAERSRPRRAVQWQTEVPVVHRAAAARSGHRALIAMGTVRACRSRREPSRSFPALAWMHAAPLPAATGR